MTTRTFDDSPPAARAGELALTALLLGYPDDEVAPVLADLDGWMSERPPFAPLAMALAEEGLEGVRARHTRLFDCGGTPLVESEYGRMRGMAKGATLADLAGFCRAFGLEVDRCGGVPPDHLGAELELCSWLLLKEAVLAERGDREGVAIVSDARRKLLVEHLGSFAPAVAARPAVAADPVYGPLLAHGAALVARECALAGVIPAPLDFFDDPELASPASCGGLRLPLLDDPGPSPGGLPC